MPIIINNDFERIVYLFEAKLDFCGVGVIGIFYQFNNCCVRILNQIAANCKYMASCWTNFENIIFFFTHPRPPLVLRQFSVPKEREQRFLFVYKHQYNLVCRIHFQNNSYPEMFVIAQLLVV